MRSTPRSPDDDYVGDYRAIHPDGRVIDLAAAGRAFFTSGPANLSGRRAVRIQGTIRDVSEARQAERERQKADALLRTILETAQGLIYAKDRDGRMLLANRSMLELIGKSWEEVEGRTDKEFLPDQEQAMIGMANDRQVIDAIVVEERVGERVWLSTKSPLRDSAGQVIGLVGLSVEISERKRAEERLRLLINELNHRVKNTLASVQAIASQTLRLADAATRATFEQRLMALASAHDTLTHEAWTGAALHDVLAGALDAFQKRDGRFRIAGPAVRLQPQAALALALHELATNALKYGALSAIDGHVEICWEISCDDAPRLRFTWREQGGSVVAPPLRRGFGTQLIERSLMQDLGGSVALEFAAAGVTCVIDTLLAEVAAVAELLTFPGVGETRRM